MQSITIVYESPIGDFRVIQRSDTTYYYPQMIKVVNGFGLSGGPRWCYLYIGEEYKDDDRISEPLVSLAMRYEQCVNGNVHECKGGAV